MDVTVQAAGLDAALQARQADDGIARRFDLIIIQAISEQGIVPVLTRAKQAGIPVILVNNSPRTAPRSSMSPSSGRTRTRWGGSSGQAVLQALKASGRDGGKVALITGALQAGPRSAPCCRLQAGGRRKPEGGDRRGRGRALGHPRPANASPASSMRGFAAGGGLDAVYGMADNQAVAAIKAAEAASIAVGTAQSS